MPIRGADRIALFCRDLGRYVTVADSGQHVNCDSFFCERPEVFSVQVVNGDPSLIETLMLRAGALVTLQASDGRYLSVGPTPGSPVRLRRGTFPLDSAAHFVVEKLSGSRGRDCASEDAISLVTVVGGRRLSADLDGRGRLRAVRGPVTARRKFQIIGGPTLGSVRNLSNPTGSAPTVLFASPREGPGQGVTQVVEYTLERRRSQPNHTLVDIQMTGYVRHTMPSFVPRQKILVRPPLAGNRPTVTLHTRRVPTPEGAEAGYFVVQMDGPLLAPQALLEFQATMPAWTHPFPLERPKVWQLPVLPRPNEDHTVILQASGEQRHPFAPNFRRYAHPGGTGTTPSVVSGTLRLNAGGRFSDGETCVFSVFTTWGPAAVLTGSAGTVSFGNTVTFTVGLPQVPRPTEIAVVARVTGPGQRRSVDVVPLLILP